LSGAEGEMRVVIVASASLKVVLEGDVAAAVEIDALVVLLL
jgi:hypothetical protein